jgi:hypothetical protein
MRIIRNTYVGMLISLWLFLFAAQPKEFFLDGLKKLEKPSHKCVELRGECIEEIHFFNPVACCFLYKAKDLSAPLVCDVILIPIHVGFYTVTFYNACLCSQYTNRQRDFEIHVSGNVWKWSVKLCHGPL